MFHYPNCFQISRATLRRLKQRKQDDTIDEVLDADVGETSTSQAQSPSAVIHHRDNVKTSSLSSDSAEVSSSASDSENDSDSSSSRGQRSPMPNTPSSQSDVSWGRNTSASDSSSDEEGNQAVYEGSDTTINKSLYDVLKLCIEEKWTKKSFSRNVKLIKRLLPQPNDFPSSGKSAFKLLKDLTVKSYCEQEYLYCSECLQLIEDGSESCLHCECSNLEKFYMFPPQVQIKHFFEQRHLAKVIDMHRSNHGRRMGYICDINDGAVYKSVKQHLHGPYDIVLVLNTDGVAMSKSSKQEMWLVLGTVCEIPPKLRPSFLIVIGIFISNQKPDMNVFLKPLVNSMKESFNKGVTWVHPESKESITSKIVAPFLSADAPAKSMVLKSKRFNARYGCNICEQKAEKIELTAEEIRENEAQINPRKKIRRKRRFLFKEDEVSAILRTGERMNAQGALAEERGKSRKGVIGHAVVSGIPFFDRAHSVCAEYVHVLTLGGVKYFLEKIFFEKGEWYIGDKLEAINEFLSKIEVPDFVKRLPRGIDDFKFWKASEFRNFLLYYSLPLFADFLPSKYYQHWLLLVSSSYILLKDAISETELKSAEIMLKSFVRDVGSLYGPACYTYDVHNLVHLVLLVQRCGNLWATSAFTFETFNGFVSAQLHGTKHLEKELANNINICQSVSVLGGMVNAEQDRCSTQPSQLSEVGLLGKPLDHCCLSEEEVAALAHVGLENVAVYIRAKVMSSIYTSKFYDTDKKRSNSYLMIEPKDNQPRSYGQSVVFCKSASGSVFCLLKTFKVLQNHIIFHENTRFIVKHLLPVEYSGELSVIPVERITTKLLKIGMYLAIRPNSIEVNL